jgi:hypothetical protein
MKHKLMPILLILLFSACGFTQSVPVNSPTPTTRTNANESSDKKLDSGLKDNQTESSNKQDSFECVRSTPESILKENHFIESNFTLRKNEEYPFQMLGLETAKFKNGDRLTIENIGCENYTLVFRFETERFSGDVSDTRYWYRAASQLIEQTKKGIADDTGLVKNGTKALSSYIRKNKKPAFNAEIEFGGKEIRSAVTISEPIKRSGKTVEIEITFGIGPL